MAGRLSDLLDVEGAHALLHARGAGERRRLLAEEVRLERDHAGVDEQQVGVVVDERRARHDGVRLSKKVSQRRLISAVSMFLQILGSKFGWRWGRGGVSRRASRGRG